MKRILPWLLLPYLTLAQADSHNSLENMLSQVSEEASETTLESIETATPKATTSEEPSVVEATDVNVDELTQSIAGRLSELLGTNTETNPQQLSVSLESVVSSALRDGKEMDDIRDAVAQAMKDVTGQSLQLNPDVAKIEAELQSQGKPSTPTTPATQKKTSPVTEAKPETKPVINTSASIGNNAQTKTAEPVNSGDASIATANTTTVLAGESLFRVAQRVYGEENGRRFLDLYEANKDIIENVNVVFEGQVLQVPE